MQHGFFFFYIINFNDLSVITYNNSDYRIGTQTENKLHTKTFDINHLFQYNHNTIMYNGGNIKFAFDCNF